MTENPAEYQPDQKNSNVSNHTPGPWEYYEEEGRFVIAANGEQGGEGIAVTAGRHYDRESNAALIAAAPDLLEALEMALFHAFGGPGFSKWREKARDAIAKAKGQ